MRRNEAGRRAVALLVAATMITVTLPLAAGGTPVTGSEDEVEGTYVPQVVKGFAAHPLTAVTGPTEVIFHHDVSVEDPGEQASKDLYYADLTGSITHLSLEWTPAGPLVVDRAVIADGFNQPIGIAFDDDDNLYVSDSYQDDVADRPLSIVYQVDPQTGDRAPIVDRLPSGQHHVNQIKFGPDDRLYLPLGNPNDSGNGTGTGHTDIFPITGAFLNVDTGEVPPQTPAILHWEDEDGDRIADEDLLDHELNQDFLEKVDVFAFGFRNIYSLAWAPEHVPFEGQLYTGTNGANVPANSQDTFQQVHPDTHHGYPFCVSQGQAGATDGIEIGLWEGSPHEDFDCERSPPADGLLGWHVCATGIDFPTPAEEGYPDFTFPQDKLQSAFIGECGPFDPIQSLEKTLEQPSLHNTGHQVTEVALDDEGDATDMMGFVEGLNLPTDVTFGPDGAMYAADVNKILRIAPTPLTGPASDLLDAAEEAAPTSQQQEDCDEADVQLEDDSCGTVLSVSLAGDASGTSCRGTSACVTVSGTGDASNAAADRSCGYGSLAPEAACIAVSGTGDAENRAGDNSCGYAFIAAGAGCVAVSGTGEASNEAGGFSCGHGGSGAGSGCIAVSGTGQASNEAGAFSCGVGIAGVGVGCVAVSGAGSASNSADDPGCGSQDVGLGIGCLGVNP